MQDLDLRRPGVWRPAKGPEFETTTKEVLEKADFRVSLSVINTCLLMILRSFECDHRSRITVALDY
jgi:hypothetical protein